MAVPYGNISPRVWAKTCKELLEKAQPSLMFKKFSSGISITEPSDFYDDDIPEVEDALYICCGESAFHGACDVCHCRYPHEEDTGFIPDGTCYDPVMVDGLVGEAFESNRQTIKFIRNAQDNMARQAESAQNSHIHDALVYGMHATYADAPREDKEHANIHSKTGDEDNSSKVLAVPTPL